jgi:hypothetical protein
MDSQRYGAIYLRVHKSCLIIVVQLFFGLIYSSILGYGEDRHLERQPAGRQAQLQRKMTYKVATIVWHRRLSVRGPRHARHADRRRQAAVHQRRQVRTSFTFLAGSLQSALRGVLVSETEDVAVVCSGCCRLQASDKDWAQLQDKFLLYRTVAKGDHLQRRADAFVDLLLACLVLKHVQKAEPSLAADFKVNAVLLTMKFVVLSNFST